MKAILPISMTCLLLVTGCQTVPERLPQAEPAPSAACYFPSDQPSQKTPSLEVLTQSIGVLETWGFELETTDTDLGLVTASRRRDLIGYYDPYDNDFGYGRNMRVFGGFGLGRGGSSIGLGIGGGFGAGFRHQPVEVERVSLLARDGYIRLSRDIRRFDHLGDLRESYSASNDDFCQRFQTAFKQAAATPGAL
ncbi:hypothetical protein M0220_05055 [Halomonas qinghailakensis]|uniref:DUF4136 domain-containing protein n=1 Tax=Halomonas qinghailakensis TaxID=2937790 RepID=A0AA46TS36_9GAMM|nr:hypothetical protein [Halomonas sp. ZZQ-149]UYO75528.1 hypothetical protein M0220_05055 [Halomonas sp. ZZQ-149]